MIRTTSRDQPKSAPHPRLKIAKGHQSSKVFSSTAPKKFFEKSLATAKKIEGGTLWDFSIPSLSQNPTKLKGGPFGENFFSKKVSQRQKKLKGGTLWDFSIPSLSQNPK